MNHHGYDDDWNWMIDMGMGQYLSARGTTDGMSFTIHHPSLTSVWLTHSHMDSTTVQPFFSEKSRMMHQGPQQWFQRAWTSPTIFGHCRNRLIGDTSRIAYFVGRIFREYPHRNGQTYGT